MTKFPEDYMNDILVRMAYHNSAIEGNAITLPETVSIIIEGTTPGNKSIREFYEIENHKETFHYIFKLYAHSEKLSIPIIKKITPYYLIVYTVREVNSKAIKMPLWVLSLERLRQKKHLY